MSAAAAVAPEAADVVAFLRRFLDSPDGELAARTAAAADAPAVVELRLHEPDAVLSIDLAARTVSEGGTAAASARVDLGGRDLNDLLLDRLGPVEISRLLEEGRLHLEGPPPALAALLLVAAQLQAHYPASLRERGRTELLGAAAPATGVVWESDEPPPSLVGRRRRWQRPKQVRS